METVVSFLAGYGVDFWNLVKISGVLLLGALLISGVLRFIFGKKTLIGHAISSSIAIIFIYILMAVILTLIPTLHWLLTPLPFASFTQTAVSFHTLSGFDYTMVASQLLSMVILSFLVNLLDTWLPNKKNLFSWIFWRCVTVALGLVLHWLVCWLFSRYLPEGIVIYAPVILLVILLVMLMTGALRLVVGAVLTTINPVIAALYTFFFATLVGKQLTKAVLTTGILLGVISLLQNLGMLTLSLASAAMVAYIPFLLLLVLVWYIINKVF